MFNVLDACCGSRGFWFNKKDERAIFMDKRIEVGFTKKAHGNPKVIKVHPDVQADFTALPFKSDYFDMVVFDPPHLRWPGQQSDMAKRYGRLEGDWEFDLGAGFEECFRVLRPAGVLIFKWSETNIVISRILDLVNERPLFGHKSGKNSKTHWVSFIKRG